LDRIEPFVASLASQAEEPSIVLAWNVFTNHVLAARCPDSSVADYLTALLNTPQKERQDWFAYLNVPRNQQQQEEGNSTKSTSTVRLLCPRCSTVLQPGIKGMKQQQCPLCKECITR
jgi:hypothetical protein